MHTLLYMTDKTYTHLTSTNKISRQQLLKLVM